MTFQLRIFGRGWHDLSLGYAAPAAMEILQALPLDTCVLAIGVDELEGYDWELQRLTLTRAATALLAGELLRRREQPEEVRVLTELKRRLGWGHQLEFALSKRCFVVSCQDLFVYGGIFLDAPSQMAIDYPVARVSVEEERAVIALLPLQIPFVMVDPVDASGAMRGLAITPEAEADVRQLQREESFFPTWIAQMAQSPKAAAFRLLLRDQRIYASLAVTNKLR